MIELPEIEAFLASLPAFSDLPPGARRDAAAGTVVEYFARDSTILSIGDRNPGLHIVRSGAVQLVDKDDTLVARLGEGESFGLASLMNDAPVRLACRALEDSLIYCIDGAVFTALRQANTDFATYFLRTLTDRLIQRPTATEGIGATGSDVGALLSRAPVTLASGASIRDAAALMTQQRVSALMIIQDQRLAGIVTDRDLRSRVIAAGVDPVAPVDSIMTANPITIAADAHAYEAALTMMHNRVHHLPVTRDGEPAGLVTRSDFMRVETEHPLYLVQDLARAKDAATVAATCARLPALLRRLIASNASGAQLGRFITAITDAATRQLLRIGERQLGPAPLPYAWIALGSQARQEQSAKSDQDNALIIDASDEDAARHDDYFAQLAGVVNDGLNACGYVYCPGDIMGRTGKWRVPLARWKEYFYRWIHVPEEKALMHANIFFDLRCIDGDDALVQELKDYIVAQAANQQIFLALMAKNALAYPPPLGFFRQFVLESSGEHRNTLNLKLNGIMPIVEIARIRALACGQMRAGTRNRLHAAARAGELTADDASSLIDALDLLEAVRLQHQSEQMSAGQPPDNHLAPDTLSPLARQNLKAAFAQIRVSQSALVQRFGAT